jgi:predicted DCC family thiol-disulfide oxidoreductase YuxK
MSMQYEIRPVTSSQNHPIHLFDGVCVLCSYVVQYILKHEVGPEIHFISIQSDTGRALAIEHDIDPDMSASFIFLEDGVAHKQSDGVIALSKYLTGLSNLICFGNFMPRPIRDWAYDRVALNRYRLFGKTDTCFIPNEANKHRFIV